MPIFYQHSINETTKLGIWKIEEPEPFFLEKAPLTTQVTHPYKRLQHLAGRYLLSYLFPDFPVEEIRIADTRKPFLHDEKYHFSISHCGNFATAIVSSTNRVGVDLELVTPRIRNISSKFLSEAEKNYLQDWLHLPALHLEMITTIWCSKEALFKWYGLGNVDFRRHLRLNGMIAFHPGGWLQIPFLFEKGAAVPLNVMARSFDGLILAFVYS